MLSQKFGDRYNALRNDITKSIREILDKQEDKELDLYETETFIYMSENDDYDSTLVRLEVIGIHYDKDGETLVLELKNPDTDLYTSTYLNNLHTSEMIEICQTMENVTEE